MAGRGNPRQRGGLVLDGAGDETAVLDPEEDRRYALNATAAALWELCDGRTSPAEMVDALCLLFRAEPTTISGDVDRVLEQFATLGLIEWEDESGD